MGRLSKITFNMTIEKIQFTHAAFISWLIATTYNRVPAINLTQEITFNIYWARLIGLYLKHYCGQQHPAAFKTMEELGFEAFTEETWELAGEMILNNEKLVIN